MQGEQFTSFIAHLTPGAHFSLLQVYQLWSSPRDLLHLSPDLFIHHCCDSQQADNIYSMIDLYSPINENPWHFYYFTSSLNMEVVSPAASLVFFTSSAIKLTLLILHHQSPFVFTIVQLIVLTGSLSLFLLYSHNFMHHVIVFLFLTLLHWNYI